VPVGRLRGWQALCLGIDVLGALRHRGPSGYGQTTCSGVPKPLAISGLRSALTSTRLGAGRPVPAKCVPIYIAETLDAATWLSYLQ
jgi:hypothetical protein